MELDIEKSLMLKIEGELGKFQSLSIEALIEISQNLQKFILCIAENTIDSEYISLSNFKIELNGFGKSSAVPEFCFSQRASPTIDSNLKNQRQIVSNNVAKIFSISAEGDYSKIIDLFPDVKRRNPIIETYYNFSNSFKDSPVSIVKKNGLKKDDYEKIYTLNKFTKKAKESISGKIEKLPIDKKEEFVVAEVKITGKNQKIVKTYNKDKHSLSYSPEVIIANDKKYILNFPLMCLLEKDEDIITIKNNFLDITAYGKTEEEAELDFNQDFDYLYCKLIDSKEENLSKRYNRIKLIIKSLVKEVL